jgi:hypothetical protein
MSAGQMADGLVSAMGGSNGSVTKSEFENFVTSNGGTTSEADTDFSELASSSSATLTAGDLEQAIENQQSSASSSTSNTSSTASASTATSGTASANISPILAWLDSLSATASGTPTA